MKSMRPNEANKRGNVITARIVPLFLLGIFGYSCWVVTSRVCVNYLINPPQPLSIQSHTGSAAAILVIFYLLLLITLLCFGRLGATIVTKPGLVPRGEQYWIEKERKRREDQGSGPKEETFEYRSTEEGYTPRDLRRRQDPEGQGFRAQDFWRKDVFVCGWDGRPPFCSTCYNYKPDRAHHCRELGRCVLKMDHFCPWVGGIVSETSFKFFIQFTGWAALFCLHTLVVMAYYFAHRRSQQHDFLNVHWILVLILAGLFFIFTAGMCGSSLQFAFLNSTTIENFSRKTKIWYLAVYMPPKVLERYQNAGRTDLRLITYPRPPEEQFQVLRNSGATLPNESEQTVARQPYDPNASTSTPTPIPTPTRPANTYDPQSAALLSSPPANFPPTTNTTTTTTTTTTSDQPMDPTSPPPSSPLKPPASLSEPLRTFAILESAPGANPFDIGAFSNFKQVMGYTVLDWIFPLHFSPLVDHADPDGMYKYGRAVRKMKRNAGLSGYESGEDAGEEVLEEKKRGGREHQHRKKKRRRRRRTETLATGDTSGAE